MLIYPKFLFLFLTVMKWYIYFFQENISKTHHVTTCRNTKNEGFRDTENRDSRKHRDVLTNYTGRL